MSLPGNWTSGQSFSAAAENSVEIAVNANTKARPIADLYANRPAASSVTTGTLFFCTDCDAVYQSTGTAWNKVRVGGGGNPQLMADPPSSGLSTTTLGSATFAADRDGRLLTAPGSGAAAAMRAEYSTLSPASGYTVTAKIDSCFAPANYHLSGIVLINTTSNSLIVWGMCYDTAVNSSGPGLSAFKYSSPTATSASYAAVPEALGSISWLQIKDDGTNRYFNYSYNGLDWITAYSVSRTDFITPNAVGWGADNETSGTDIYRLRSFKITTP